MKGKGLIIPYVIGNLVFGTGCATHTALAKRNVIAPEQTIEDSVIPPQINYSKNCAPRPFGIKPDTIIFHYTAKVDYTNNYKDASTANLEACVESVERSGLSYHVVINRAGKSKWMVHPDMAAYHAGPSITPDGRMNANRFSVGISFIADPTSRDKEARKITDKQLLAAAEIVNALEKKYNTVFHQWGHEHVAGDNMVQWGNRKYPKLDPGMKSGNFDMGKYIDYFTFFSNHQGDGD